MKMQVIKHDVKYWTIDDDNFIIENYLSMSDKDIGIELERSQSAVKNERLKLKLIRPRVKRKNNKKREALSFEQIKQIFIDKNYTLLSSEDEYINQSSKLRYICNKHYDKGEQFITVYHLKEGKGCYYCGRERTNEARKKEINPDEDRLLCELKGFEYITTQRENGKIYVYFICKKHRILGIQKMTRGNLNRECVHGCQYCNGKNLPHWYVKDQIETKYPHILVLSEFNGMNQSLKCYCKKHNEFFTQVAKEVFYYGRGCSCCTNERRSNCNKLSNEEIIFRAIQLNPDIEVLDVSNYENYYSKILVKCKKCGNIWNASLGDLHNQNGHCPFCYIRSSTSVGELNIFNILEGNHIKYAPHYSIGDCKNVKPLPFDAAIFDSDMCLKGLIEYQGEQHYKPIDYFGGEEKYKQRQINDRIKEEYCNKHNIPLLIIPYWDFNNIDIIVMNFIDKIIE